MSRVQPVFTLLTSCRLTLTRVSVWRGVKEGVQRSLRTEVTGSGRTSQRVGAVPLRIRYRIPIQKVIDTRLIQTVVAGSRNISVSLLLLVPLGLGEILSQTVLVANRTNSLSSSLVLVWQGTLAFFRRKCHLGNS